MHTMNSMVRSRINMTVQRQGSLRRNGYGLTLSWRLEEKTYKVMGGSGALSIALGVVSLVVGVASGVLLVISGAKLLAGRNKILF